MDKSPLFVKNNVDNKKKKNIKKAKKEKKTKDTKHTEHNKHKREDKEYDPFEGVNILFDKPPLKNNKPKNRYPDKPVINDNDDDTTKINKLIQYVNYLENKLNEIEKNL